MIVHLDLADRIQVTGGKMEITIRTRSYQDPLEDSFEKLVPWVATFTSTDTNAPVHFVADDFSDRQIALPVGVILELAEALQFQQSLTN
jgi:hypothetical protein